MKRALVIAAVLFGTIGCDQATKVIARDALSAGPSVSLFGGLVRLVYAQNPGAFLSLGAGMSDTARFWIFTALVAGVLAWAAWKLATDRAMGWLRTVAWTLVVAGGLGNLIDRLARGSVIDFMIVGAGPVHTGIFNVADVAIMAGLAILLFSGKEAQSSP